MSQNGGLVMIFKVGVILATISGSLLLLGGMATLLSVATILLGGNPLASMGIVLILICFGSLTVCRVIEIHIGEENLKELV